MVKKLSDLFTYKEESPEWCNTKDAINEGIDKALEKEDANKDTLLLMKELLNSRCNSMEDYYTR